MNARSLVWLGAGFAVLAGLAVIGQRQTVPETSLGDNRTFLPGLTDSLDQITAIEIVAAGDTPVVTLARDTGGWTVADRSGYRADLTKVRHTLLSLAEAEILEPKTADPALHSRLGVEAIEADDAAGLEVTLRGPASPATVVIGEAEGDYRRYARRAGEEQSYLINRDPELGESAADWLDTAVVDLRAERVREVTVTHPDGEILRVFKASSGQPNFTVEAVPEGRSLLYESAANVMGSVLQNLTLEDVAPTTAPAAEPTVTELATFDGLVLTVRGIERDDGTWVSFAASTAADVPGEPASGPAATAAEDASSDPAQEAAEINARLQGWRYKIPSYKFEQLTRRMADLLQAQSQQ